MIISLARLVLVALIGAGFGGRASGPPEAAETAALRGPRVVAPAAAQVAMAQVTLEVSGIDCASCHYRVIGALGAVGGVIEVAVRPTRDPSVLRAVVGYDPALASPEALIAATSRLGYPTAVVAD